MRRKPTWTSWCWLCAFWAIGCSDEGNNALDPNSWSGMHVSAIEQDCSETVQCKAQRGEPLVDDPVNNCIQATAELLERDTSKQDQFVNNNTRCANFVVCQYFDCVITNATSSYGQSQLAAITQDCTAEYDCDSLSGVAPADRDSAISTCIATNTSLLNNFSGEMRTQYETAYASCQMLTGCDFVSCFGF